MRERDHANASASAASLADVTAGWGQGRPLLTATRAFFEPRFGRDFGQVRVHEGDRAARTAHALRAQAFTVRNDIVLGDGVSEAMGPTRLLAHELAHTIQPDGLQVRRAPLDPQAGGGTASNSAQVEATSDQTPVEIPEHVSPEIDQLASDTAERIDDVIESDWEGAVQSGWHALLTASKVEGILTDVFEKGYSLEPQLGAANAPLLQYHVSLHPGLRDRLAVLRQLAGPRKTERIGRYLDIPMGAADAYTYEMKMWGMSGGEGGEGTRQYVRIRYVENGEPQWTRTYDFVAGGVGMGVMPGVISGDITWNTFYANEYWAPEDFSGPMMIVGAGIGAGIGWEVEGATLTGNGKHSPISADIGGFMWTSPEAGLGSYTGRLIPWLGKTPDPAPPPGRGVLPPPPPYVQRPQVHDQITIQFPSGQSNITYNEHRRLTEFVERWKDVFDGGMFNLQLIGYASRTGSTTTNDRLSDSRWKSVLDAIEQMLGYSINDEDHLSADGVGEEQARLEGRDPNDDSASDRIVEVTLNGRRTVPVGQTR